jgi:hypothetical protein
VADSPVRHAPRAVPAPAPAQPRPAPSTPAPRPAPDPTPEPEPTAKPAPAPHTPTGPTTTTATPAPTPAAAAPAPAAAAPEPAPAGPAAPPAAGEITVYSQSPGFGGPLSIRRANGEVVNSYFGEHAVLNCYRVRPDGTVASHETCGRDRLVAGTTIALAEHAPNASGSDVWTHVELIVPA